MAAATMLLLRALVAAATLLSVALVSSSQWVPGSLNVTECSGGRPQQWSLDADSGALQLLASGACVTAAMLNGTLDTGGELQLLPCRAPDAAAQSWALTPQAFIVSTSNPDLCLVVSPSASHSAAAAHGEAMHAAGAAGTGSGSGGSDTPDLTLQDCTAPTSPCVSEATQNQCQWSFGTGHLLHTKLNAQCLTAPAEVPRTCDAGSVSAQLPFCDVSLGITARVKDLVSRLNVTDKIDLVSHSGTPTAYVPNLNLKSTMNNVACSHGVAFPLPYLESLPQVTVFPVPIAQAATWDADIVRTIAAFTADEARAIRTIQYNATGGLEEWGLLCTYAVNGAIARDPRWGLVSMTYGEDPYMVGTLGATAITALQNNNQSDLYIESTAGLTHFAVFSGATGGPGALDVVIDNFTLGDSYLRPFEHILAAGQPTYLLATGAALNGVPTVCDGDLLSAVSGWTPVNPVFEAPPGAVGDIVNGHHYKSSTVAAVSSGIGAGISNFLSMTNQDQQALAQAVKVGGISEAQLDTMVNNVLSPRFLLGEFDPERNNPYATVSPDVLDSPSHRQAARAAAAASVVLLQNKNNVLPLTYPKYQRIAVIGPSARDHSPNFATNVYLHVDAGYNADVVDIMTGVFTAAQDLQQLVSYTRGCVVDSGCYCCTPTVANFTDAVQAAQAADVAIIAVGLTQDFESATVDRSSLQLPGVQVDLIRQVANTGTPVVVVLVNGGPVNLQDAQGDVLHDVDAVVEAWYGGVEAGNGVADILFGTVNPSGRLPVTLYWSEQQLPPFNNYDMEGRTYKFPGSHQRAMFSFGYGLSYTTFSYSQLQIQPTVATAIDTIDVSVNVTNAGTLGGAEVTQLYIQAPSAPGVLGPLYALKGFSRNYFHRGQSAFVAFSLDPSHLLSVKEDGTRVVLPGVYNVWVGGHQPNDELAPGPMLHSTFQILDHDWGK